MKLRNNIRLFITCDSGAGAGKTTASKFLSKRYNLNLLTSGLLYRMVAYKLLSAKKTVKNVSFLRKITKNSETIFDTFIFFEENENLRNKIVQHLKKQGFGTKNLPDAIEWHCASFWDHALTKDQINRTKKTQNILNKAIAIPIWLKKSVKDYSILGKDLKNLK